MNHFITRGRINLYAFCAAAMLCVFSYKATSQITITGGYSAAALAASLTGTGVTVFGATLTCPSESYGEFSLVSSTLGIGSGVLLTNGLAISPPGAGVGGSGPYGVNIINGEIPDAAFPINFASTDNLAPNDADLDALVFPPPLPGTTHNACILELNFKPNGDTIKFNYVFGSEEYTDFACTEFNDVFGFFISGGAYTTPTNIALIPGTTIPVCINSVNCGATGGGSLSTCTEIGPGSPFCAYYVNNSTSTTSFIMYDGLTTIMTAQAIVSPCDTYHLKLGVEDVGDEYYDSGVFIEAGSLSSPPPPTISAVGDGGLPYCVRGCNPGSFKFTIPTIRDTAVIIRYAILGTAINGYDYATIADSIIIPIGSLMNLVDITPILVPPAGPKVVTLGIITQNPCTLVDTITAEASLTILDSFSFRILTSDTTICIGQDVNVIAVGDTIFASLLHYTWAPTATVTGDTALLPIVTPTVTTAYILTDSADAALGCASESRVITVTVLHPAPLATFIDTICMGMSDSFNVAVHDSQTYHYLWTPPDFVSNDTLPYPVITPTVGGTFTWNITIQPNVAAGCINTDVVTLVVIPNAFPIYPPDTAICLGKDVQVIATSYPFFHYQWLPTAGIAFSNIVDPLITPDTSATYVVTASFHGCPDIHDTLWLDVQPNPTVYIGGNRITCQYDTTHIFAAVSPAWYAHYMYSWTPVSALYDPAASEVVFSSNSSTEVSVTVSTPAGCASGDSALITVNPGDFASLPQLPVFCPHDSIVLMPSGGVSYRWIPSIYISDSAATNPVLAPNTTQSYSMVATSADGCTDTLYFTAVVQSGALIQVGDSVTLYPGETYQISAQTNCTVFSWFPAAGLDNTHISNPLASPELSTKYIVHAETEWGCKAVDSINIYIDPETLLAIPNAFTPGSGPNNEFKIIKQGIATLKYFRIFNRWGNVVFETDNIDQGWNGEYNGVPQPFGVYVYDVEAVTSTGKIFHKHGNTTLIR